MTRTKTTPHEGKANHPRGMAAATFTGSTKAGPEQQYHDAQGEDTEDSQDWPKYGEEEDT